MGSLFDDMFDYNNDGKIDFIEEGVGMDIIDDIYKKSTGESDLDDDFDSYNDDFDDDLDDDLDDGFDDLDNDSDNGFDDMDIGTDDLDDGLYTDSDINTTSEKADISQIKSNNESEDTSESPEPEPEPEVWTEDYYISGLYTTFRQPYQRLQAERNDCRKRLWKDELLL